MIAPGPPSPFVAITSNPGSSGAPAFGAPIASRPVSSLMQLFTFSPLMFGMPFGPFTAWSTASSSEPPQPATATREIATSTVMTATRMSDIEAPGQRRRGCARGRHAFRGQQGCGHRPDLEPAAEEALVFIGINAHPDLSQMPGAVD